MTEFLRRQDGATDYTTSVCTGAAILAPARSLEGRRAATNKNARNWATGQGAGVIWQPRARWVVGGRYVTSSGVAAGTDMALGLVELIYGRERAESIAADAEYVWNAAPDEDPFAREQPGFITPGASAAVGFRHRRLVKEADTSS